MKTSTTSSGTHRPRHYRLRTTQLLLLLLLLVLQPIVTWCTLLTSINSRHVVELDFTHRLSAAVVDQEGPVDSWRMTNITVLDKKFQCVLPNLGGIHTHTQTERERERETVVWVCVCRWWVCGEASDVQAGAGVSAQVADQLPQQEM